MATIRKRGSNYQIRVSLGYDVTGKQIEKSTTWKPPIGMTEKQIKKELNRQAVLFEEKCLTGQFLDGNITFSDFTEKWFKEYAEKQLKARTLDCYREYIPRITKAIGHIKLYKLQPCHLIEFYNNLAEQGVRADIKYTACTDIKKLMNEKGFSQKSLAERANVAQRSVHSAANGGNVVKATADKIAAALGENDLFIPVNADKTLSGATVKAYHGLISSILTTAVQWQLIPSNPCHRVKPPQNEHKEAVILDDKQTKELILCLDKEPLKFKTAIMLILYTGLRRGELCGLNWSDIDFDNNIVLVNKSLLYTPSKGVYEDTPKTKRSSRAVQIPSDMTELLKQYHKEQLKQKLLLGDLWQNTDRVFTNDIGGNVSPCFFSTQFKKFLKRHNLPDIHIHTLRHISATLLIANGVDIATVSNRLGHSDKSTTLNIYTHAIKAADEKAAEKLQDIFKTAAII